MSSPQSSSFQRPDLGQTLMEFDLDGELSRFIGLRVFPLLTVERQTANFGLIPLEQLLFDTDTHRAPGSGYSRSEMKHDQNNYNCQQYGHEEPVDDSLSEIYSYLFDAEMMAGKRARNVVLRGHERRVAAQVFNTTTWTTGNGLRTNVSTAWTNKANAQPVDDVLAAIDKVRKQCGEMPNAVIMNWTVFKDCVRTANVIDQIKYNGPMDPSRITASSEAMAALAALFQVDQVIVSPAVRNTANESKDAVLTDIWAGRLAQVAKLPTSNDLSENCLGRTFRYNSSLLGFDQYREENKSSEIIRYRDYLDEKLLRPQCAHMLGNL